MLPDGSICPFVCSIDLLHFAQWLRDGAWWSGRNNLAEDPREPPVESSALDLDQFRPLEHFESPFEMGEFHSIAS